MLDGSTEAQRTLITLINAKNVTDERRFVYTVQEKKCNLVFPAGLEAAVRDGDVRDVMMAKDSDTILIKMKQGKNVSMDFIEFEENCELYDGEGPNEHALREIEIEQTEKKKRKRKQANLTKKFEERDKLAEIQEQKEEKLKEERLAKKLKLETKIPPKEAEIEVNNNVVVEEMQHFRSKSSIIYTSGDWRDLTQPLIESWDWDTFEREAAAAMGIPRITIMPQPIRAEPVQLSAEIQKVSSEILELSTGFENVPSIEPFSPVTETPDSELLSFIKNISVEKLESTIDIKEKLANIEAEFNCQLPLLEEIPKVVKEIGKGKRSTINKVSGLTLNIEAAQKFIPGQIIETPIGEKFVPGQTVSTPAGPVFVPGFTVFTPDGPALVPGHTFMDKKTNEPIFVAGQMAETSQGEQFVHGQTIRLEDGTLKFVEGQTIQSSDGPKFVPGKVSRDETNKKNTFVPGQTIVTNEGPKFIPGQTIKHENGEMFVPGQNVCLNSEWQFVPGQTIVCFDGVKFVPGTTLNTSQGPKFVAGQTILSKDGNPIFVPGISVENKGDVSFIPGTTVETVDGPKFIQGQIVNTPEGEKFIPGNTVIGPNGEIQFAIARSVKDISFMEPTPTGLAIDNFSMGIINDSLCVFGHMVQTEKGIEFYPGNLCPIVDGKTVSGRLIRGDVNGAKFVPGMMIDGGFVPGQVVFTENGEKFVPGQVVETLDGPKFVPGQVVDTKTGPKFVPGQTVETEEGPRFVPGQIVETKAGPTFIPGQVISTAEEGSRFVPGQVVDTDEGPRFVPGRVIETSDRGITFVPGQIVQTAEGPKFVAPDLVEGEEGLEFSVQSFVVTPEELKLLKVQSDTTSTKGELSIDSNMLRQLSEAGMSVGRQVPADVPAVDIVLEHTANTKILKSFISDFGFKDEVANQLMTVITSIVEMSTSMNKKEEAKSVATTKVRKTSIEMKKNNRNKKTLKKLDAISEGGQEHQNNNENVKNAIAAAVLAAMVIAEQFEQDDNNNKKDKYRSVLNSINSVLGKSLNESLVSSMYDILQTEEEKELLCEQIIKHSSQNKAEILKLAINNTASGEIINEEIVVDKLSTVLRDEKSCLGPAFKNISKSNSELLKHVLQNISEGASSLATEQQATETLQKAIVTAVRQTSDMKLDLLLSTGSDTELKQLLIQSAGLAKTIGMHDVASSLLNLVSDPQSMRKMSGDQTTMDILRRLMVMKELAERTPNLSNAIRKLEADPELARTDPKLRELVRESAALMILPEEPPLLTSADVPTKLFNNENSLAMEDFLLQRKKHPGTVLIMKKGLQAVIPRESSRAVLTGQVAYTLLDETGIRHFEPLHVFSALRLNQPTAHRFSMYCCQVAKADEVETHSFSDCSSLSEDIRMTRLGGWVKSQNELLSSRRNSDQTFENEVEHTPSFIKIGSLCRNESGETAEKVTVYQCNDLFNFGSVLIIE